MKVTRRLGAWRWIAFAAAACVAAALLWWWRPQSVPGPPPVDHADLAAKLTAAFRRSPRPAYTAWFVRRVGAAQPVRITQAQRTNGDWVERIDRNPRAQAVTREVRFADGVTIFINETAGTKATLAPDRTSNLAKLLAGRDPASGCRQPYPEMDPREKAPLIEEGEAVAGLATLRLTTFWGSWVTAKWVAPELGCVVVKATGEQRSAAGRLEIAEVSIAERVARGEPDAALFATTGLREQGATTLW